MPRCQGKDVNPRMIISPSFITIKYAELLLAWNGVKVSVFQTLVLPLLVCAAEARYFSESKHNHKAKTLLVTVAAALSPIHQTLAIPRLFMEHHVGSVNLPLASLIKHCGRYEREKGY